MGTLKLNNVTALTESGGTVTVDSAVAGIPAAGVTGTLPNAVTDNITTLGTVTAGSIAGGTIISATTFPAGHVINTKVLELNDTVSVGANAGVTIVNNWLSGTAVGTNSRYRMTLYTTVYGYNSQASPDSTEIGIDVRWGITSGSEANRIGKSHAHKFSTGSYWNSLVNFHSTDAGTHEGSDGAWSGSSFYTSQTQVLSIAAGASIYWKVDIWAGTGALYWNRTAASGTNNIGHGQFMIEEIAV